MKKLIQNNLIVKASSIHGYGVFAGKDYLKDEIVEECYVIYSKEKRDNDLKNYYFRFDDNTSAIALGFGTIYNHSDQPNLVHHFDEPHNTLVFVANRNIKKGEELCHYYGDSWFADRKIIVKKVHLWRKVLPHLLGVPLRTLTILTTMYLVFLFLKSAA